MTDSLLSLKDLQRVETLQVIVKKETPFLPKVAFTLITLASLAGAIFTGLHFGLGPAGLGLRWFALWTLALAGGFLVWRLVYLREQEKELDHDAVERLTTSALERADRVSRVLGVLLILAAAGTLMVPYLDALPIVRYITLIGTAALGALMLVGVSRRAFAVAAAGVAVVLIATWAVIDAGTDWQGLIRIAHLTAFSLWLGGALWNIAVAMPSGRAHPNITAVLAGARQLDRFRWVVRFSLPTIIITGLVMAGFYTVLPLEWWLTFPGVLIPVKVLAIIALVVVFITCPLFRQCSPVEGVCNVEDLTNSDRFAHADDRTLPVGPTNTAEPRSARTPQEPTESVNPLDRMSFDDLPDPDGSV